jgi:hypothetical protein
LFDLDAVVMARNPNGFGPEQIAELRQERIISHMNSELFFKAYP